MPRKAKPTKKRLLVFNCHESWLYQLHQLDFQLDIITELSGRHTNDWDYNMRPFPENARKISLEEAQQTKKRYHCIVAHNLTDLIDIKERKEPKLLVIHSTIEGRALSEGSTINPLQMRSALEQYVGLTNTHVMAVSHLKGASWGQTSDIVPFSVNCDDYLPYEGNLAKGLRISNFIDRRPEILMWDFHQQAFHDVPVTIVGHNPNMDNVVASKDWDELKSILQSHRFFIHTANPQLEDGYNMATHEAMAAGLPILGNCNPSSPIEHGVSGFLTDDPVQLNHYAKQLIDDVELARKMGEEARKAAQRLFSPEQFLGGFKNAIETARIKKRGRA